MANENSIDVYHALMALEEKVTGTAPDPENVTTDVALALADIFRTDAPMAQETAIVNAIDTITANYGGGGGGGTTTDIWLWNATEGSDNDVLPESVEYVKGLTETGGAYAPVMEPLEFEAVTEQYMGTTIYGVRVKDAPVGADTSLAFGDEYMLVSYNIGYSPQAFPPVSAASIFGTSALAPIEGFVLSGSYSVTPGN